MGKALRRSSAALAFAGIAGIILNKADYVTSALFPVNDPAPAQTSSTPANSTIRSTGSTSTLLPGWAKQASPPEKCSMANCAAHAPATTEVTATHQQAAKTVGFPLDAANHVNQMYAKILTPDMESRDRFNHLFSIVHFYTDMKSKSQTEAGSAIPLEYAPATLPTAFKNIPQLLEDTRRAGNEYIDDFFVNYQPGTQYYADMDPVKYAVILGTINDIAQKLDAAGIQPVDLTFSRLNTTQVFFLEHYRTAVEAADVYFEENAQLFFNGRATGQPDPTDKTVQPENLSSFRSSAATLGR